MSWSISGTKKRPSPFTGSKLASANTKLGQNSQALVRIAREQQHPRMFLDAQVPCGTVKTCITLSVGRMLLPSPSRFNTLNFPQLRLCNVRFTMSSLRCSRFDTSPNTSMFCSPLKIIKQHAYEQEKATAEKTNRKYKKKHTHTQSECTNIMGTHWFN